MPNWLCGKAHAVKRRQNALPDDFLRRCRAVKAKRPRTVIAHILRHGSITTEQLKEAYGYSHPPRAARDVREHGIPLETFRVVGRDGRRIAAYRFGDPASVRGRKFSGRTALTARLKEEPIQIHGAKCALYLEPFPLAELQIDHRVPYEIAGEPDPGTFRPEEFLLLCRSANRAKSWSCEHCENWVRIKDPTICGQCYWAHPEHYAHVAMRDERRLDLVWSGAEASHYDRLKASAAQRRLALPAFVKQILARHHPPA